MRPNRIEIEGFSAFRDRTVVDLDGLDLVAFTGPTGAGKSSLIDAMTFALYGSVARYGKEKQVSPAIHQLVTEAKVRFDFEVNGIGYSAVRVLRKKASRNGPSASTAEARLEKTETAEVIAGNVKELNAAVINLLGLDFSQFTRTVVLPQGEFAQFLKDEPANRQALLRRLLDMEIYKQMGTAVRAEGKRLEQEASIISAEEERNPPPSDDQVAKLEDQRVALDASLPLIETALAEVSSLAERRQQLLDDHNRQTDAMGRLQAVEIPEAVTAGKQALSDAQDQHKKAEALLAESEQRAIDSPDPEVDDLSACLLYTSPSPRDS